MLVFSMLFILGTIEKKKKKTQTGCENRIPARTTIYTAIKHFECFSLTGIHPFEPDVVLDKLPEEYNYPATPSWE